LRELFSDDDEAVDDAIDLISIAHAEREERSFGRDTFFVDDNLSLE